ncbi:hypothetical protein ASG92_10675 [Arthrobacter sp. Soil736]|uniref:hypothetical protein n=1 Tax=Arthrobacter sp. Soil736 TaxID=1736395 RepID=UPI0006FDD861|nr:hypothetical protein [Arthrobacter sp. Soil736]KRE47676.1 hypothetical protein ASG92_10675 [Arthrobacter sp. Soil736]
MSTPPVPTNPSEPNSHEPSQDGTEARGAQPRYGQDAPQYGQNTPPAPQYGQNAPQQPQYGQNTPPAPQYGQNAPQYGQGAPQYGQGAPQQPQYGQNAPQYGQGAPQYGQQSSAPSPYGQSPYGQSPYGYPSEQPQGGGTAAGVPQLVNTSFWMIIGAGVLSVLSVLLTIPTLDDPVMRSTFEEQLRGSGQNVAFDDVKGFIIGTMVVFALIGAGLYALVAFNVRKGKNWARILGTVFAALSVFSVLPLGLNTLVALVGIAAIVMLYLPASAPYFQKPQPFANPYSQPGGPYGR